MYRREELHSLLVSTLGSNNVYFQAPPATGMRYPAIKYSRDNIINNFANNEVYKQGIRYQLTVISKDPEDEAVERVSKLPRCYFNRHYVADNLNHDVFTITY